jgi:hypothetical protein
MTAPLPLRFYNPVKELCKKVNLDYETVIGTSVTNQVIRDAFICSEIQKPVEELKAEDRKFIKHKKDFFEKKYGDRNGISADTAGSSEAPDTGRSRYDAGITVEHLQPDDSRVDKSHFVSAGVETGVSASKEFLTDRNLLRAVVPTSKWIPGRGVK